MDKETGKKGKVWLVGAGPGDAGLLTVKGAKVLERAEVVVYDHLVGREILARMDAGAERINVGKIAGHHPIPQEEIQNILIAKAQEGYRVVRLKGGDPFLFGRGGEELEALEREGIPFEVVPGVTSPLAVPAYNGIPVTHREYASSVHIITGHKKKDGETDICYRALKEAGGTLVFLMGVTALEDIRKGLLEAGMKEETPAALLQEGTTARQKKVLTTLKNITEDARKAKIKAPAILMVGRVCELSERLEWREKQPLFGMRVLLTRPRKLQSATAEKLRERGAEVLEIPTIHTEPLPVESRLSEVIQSLSSYDWIVFTSQIGVEVFFDRLRECGRDIRCLAGVKFAVIGEGTKRALESKGIFPDLMPKTYDGESLGRTLAGEGIQGKKILVPRAEKGSPDLMPILLESGALADDVPIYRTVYQACETIDLGDQFAADAIDCVVFTSASTVEGFVAAAGEIDYTKVRAACIGRQTQARAAAYGMECYVAEKAAIDSLIELVERIQKRR